MSTLGGWRQHRRLRWRIVASGLAILALLPAIPGATGTARAATSANLIPNPSFETGAQGWYGYNLTALWPTRTWATDGDTSLRVIGSDPSPTGDYVVVGTDAVPVREGVSYTASALIRGLLIPPAEQTSLQIFWLDAAGRGIGNATDSTPLLGRQELTVPATAPAGAVAAQVRLFSYSRAGYRWSTHVDNVELVVGAAAATDTLRWGKPTLVNPTTIALGTGYTETKLEPDRDYIVRLPSAKKVGGTVLIGGRNVVIVGGSITVPPGGDSDTERRGIYIKDATGTVHVEGVLIDGSGGGDFDGVAIAAPEATVQLQNLRIVGVRGDWDGFHGDIVQTWGGVRSLRVDRLTGAGNYQGLMLAPTLGPIGSVQLSRVDLTTTASSQPAEQAGGHMIWLTEGNSCSGYPVVLDDVYVRPRADRALENAVWPPANSSQTCRAVGETVVGWPYLPVTGEVKLGPPPGGSFVPPGAAGIGYVSPG